MKAIFSLLVFAWIVFAFTGCADMINSLREESAAIDRDSDREDGEGGQSDSTYAYKPKTLNGLSANNVQSIEPKVVRGYGRKLASYEDGALPGAATSGGYRRVTKEDFRDTATAENSLWDGQGQENYLFAHNKQREPGDLVTVDVEKELKREIQYQLWMTLPPEQRKLKRTPASAADANKPGADGKTAAAPAQDKATEEKAKDAAEEAAKTNLASGGKEDDLVRMEVAENLGNGLVRMVGQKRVIYRGQTRVVEVVSLVNGRDIDQSGRVKSSAFLDMKTQVIQ
jgi:flagellar basal body L-ring protein FlgH